jgi:hypothetical protein
MNAHTSTQSLTHHMGVRTPTRQGGTTSGSFHAPAATEPAFSEAAAADCELMLETALAWFGIGLTTVAFVPVTFFPCAPVLVAAAADFFSMSVMILVMIRGIWS